MSRGYGEPGYYSLLSPYITKATGRYGASGTKPFLDYNYAEIAIDTSGSTEGIILDQTKECIKRAVKNNVEQKNFEKNTLAWDEECIRTPLKDLVSDGRTYPSYIFPELTTRVKCECLLMTTDGDIIDEDIEPTKSAIDKADIKNVAAVLFMDEQKPSKLNISVFHPFLEKTQKEGGCFYLFCRRTNDSEDKLYVLMKKEPEGFKPTYYCPDPVASFNDSVKWSDLPTIPCEDLNKLQVPTTYSKNAYANLLLNDKANQINVVDLEDGLKRNRSTMKDPDFRNFMFDEFPQLYQQSTTMVSREPEKALKSILRMWEDQGGEKIDLQGFGRASMNKASDFTLGNVAGNTRLRAGKAKPVAPAPEEENTWHFDDYKSDIDRTIKKNQQSYLNGWQYSKNDGPGVAQEISRNICSELGSKYRDVKFNVFTGLAEKGECNFNSALESVLDPDRDGITYQRCEGDGCTCITYVSGHPQV